MPVLFLEVAGEANAISGSDITAELRLDGTLIAGAGPYHFGMDRDVFVHWGEKLKPDTAKTFGLEWIFSA